MFKDIFDAEEVIDCSDDFTELAQVKFLKDFGPFKADETVDGLRINYNDATFQEVDENGVEKERKCSFKVEAIIS